MKPLLFTYLLTYGGASASLFRPYIGFLVYVCFAIVKPDGLWAWAVPQGNYSRVVAMGLLAGWLLTGLGSWEFGRGKGIILSLLGYWALYVFGAFTAADQELGWMTVEPLSKAFLPVLVGMTLIDSLAKLKQLAWVIVLSQGYLAYEFNLTYYQSWLFLPQEFYHGGLDNNGIAITMVTSFGMAFFLGLHAENWWQKGLVFGLAMLMAHVVLFSNSRGGMTALIITAVACFVLIPKQPKHYLVFALAVALALRLAGPTVQQRFMSSFADEGEGADKGGKRLDHWKACCDSMVTRPLGVGPNHWPITAPAYGLPRMAAHSTWLQMGAELGLPGLLLLLSFYGLCVGRLWPLVRALPPGVDPWHQHIARMVIASLTGFFFAAQFVTVDGVELPYYITLLGAGSLKLASLPQTAWADEPGTDAAGEQPEPYPATSY